MKEIIGVLLFLCGVALGLYVGVWLMFVGGIVGIVSFIQGMIDGNTDGMLLAISLVKILFSGFVGYLSAFVLIAPASAIYHSKKPKITLGKYKK